MCCERVCVAAAGDGVGVAVCGVVAVADAAEIKSCLSPFSPAWLNAYAYDFDPTAMPRCSCSLGQSGSNNSCFSFCWVLF